MNDAPHIHPTKRESAASGAPTPLFGKAADSFVQQLRLASQAHRAGRLDEAISSYLRLLAVRPDHAELHNNLGVALRLAGKLEASVSHHRLSLAADPGNPALHSNLGNALRAVHRLDEAVKHHYRSIALSRDYAEGFFNLALCLRDLGRLDEAIGCFSRALTIHPDNRRARVEFAITLLMRGELAVGFDAYEIRKRLPETPTPDFVQPAWAGEPVQGKRILLYPEQGLSDVLLFVRFARELKRRGATVVVLCQALLKDLLRSADYIDEVVAEGEKVPEFDLHASLVSLPHLCRADFVALAAEPPYLRAPEESRIKLGRLERAKLRIGIYWAAMPGQAQDHQRSVPFEHFLALSGDPELLFFSLQGGVHQKDIQAFGAGGLVHDVGRGIFDFAEAATALSQLDLLISIDAPVAHLAAAMGVKTWVLLPSTADWRWQLGGTAAPWYPSARHFRQIVPGTWHDVFTDLRRELDVLKKCTITPSSS
ncbi:tetratricopeptide repeat-containing glycosyltransferase family protein [Reyranella sp.]|uniref:tetratricopeptide repeat-containing glycosyltransferase family protein n=1 Tax=Reyranella sp. TaxID=1929291 RepID=UPI002718890F|nr:tetratricopeptide repeat-containing glycosyltransferase family protein [Reyranella sp.]MDO8977364.1 tetratricopeptide repeat-containing glycosyltransferase family protein [Reyranella sp.]